MIDDPELRLAAYVLGIGSVVVALVWFLLVVPAERRYHERKLHAIQEQIRRREEVLNSEESEATNNDAQG
jgi:hypothetical protein